MTYTLDWSETNLGGSAVVSYGPGAVLDYADKPAGATAALSITAFYADSSNTTIAEFSIVTTGSSVMTFNYHTSTESGYDKLHIDVDGVSQAEYSGVTAWTSHAGISIASAGTHRIRFRYQKDSGSAANADRVWVALLNITNTTTVNDASGTVNTYDFEDGATPSFITTSTWTNSTSGPITGTRSMRSPASPAGSGSYDLKIEKAAGSNYATVGFDYKTDTESGWDKLFIFPNAAATNVPASGSPSTPGESGWIDYSGTTSGRIALILPAAAQTVLLRYTKDGGGNVGADAVWIDTLKMPAAGSGTTHAIASTGAGTSAGSLSVDHTRGLSASGSSSSTGSLAVGLRLSCSSTGTGQTAGTLAVIETLALSATGTGASAGSLNVTVAGSGTTHGLSSTGIGTTGGSLAVSVQLSASSTGAGTSSGSAALVATLGVSSTGTGTSAGSVGLTATLQLAASGSGTTTGSLSLGVVQSLSATGTGTSSGSAAITVGHGVISTGESQSAGSMVLNVAPGQLRAIGAVGATSGSLAVTVNLQLAATGESTTSGSLEMRVSTLRLTATGHMQSGGSLDLTEPTFSFSMPTHEEPIRVDPDRIFRPLSYFRMTHAASLVKVNGSWVSMRTPPPELLEGLTAGVDYFIGGFEYEIDQRTARDLALAGYTANPI